MAEHKEDFNQMILRAARGTPAKQQMRAFFGNSQKKKEDEKQEQ
jgi:hypothetical protein